MGAIAQLAEVKKRHGSRDPPVNFSTKRAETAAQQNPQRGINSLMTLSLTRTLRMKVRRESYAWLNAAAVEVNEVYNYCNETSYNAARRTDIKRKWLTGFDLCALATGASEGLMG
jgi:hypothetical protein